MKTRLLLIFLIITFSLSCQFPDDELLRPDFELYPREDGVDYLEVIAIGDCGTGGPGQILTASVMKNYAETVPVEFILYLGDNCYPFGFKSIYDPKWQTCFEDIYDYDIFDIPFYAMLGNHDYWGNVQAQLDYSRVFDTKFTLPAKYYSFKHMLPDGTEIHFIILDTILITENTEEGNTEYDWFRSELENSTSQWKIVLGHYPLYSNGEHGNNNGLIDRIDHLLIDYADLYIAGHEHNIELAKNATGPYYITSGTGSHIREFYAGSNTVYGSNFLGMTVLRFSANELIIMFLIDDNSIDFAFKITK